MLRLKAARSGRRASLCSLAPGAFGARPATKTPRLARDFLLDFFNFGSPPSNEKRPLKIEKSFELGAPGFEPGTSTLSVLRSNQLSYAPLLRNRQREILTPLARFCNFIFAVPVAPRALNARFRARLVFPSPVEPRSSNRATQKRGFVRRLRRRRATASWRRRLR